MREIVLKITFDDTDCYKGHGDDTGELIKGIIEQEMEMELESDNVIKPGWKVEFADNSLEEWLEGRILKEQEKYENSCDVVDKASKGGKKKAFVEVIDYIKNH